MFGGIYEITKELNDFYLYDFKKNKWITLFEESVSPKKVSHIDFTNQEDISPYTDKQSRTLNKRSISPNGKNSFMKNKK